MSRSIGSIVITKGIGNTCNRFAKPKPCTLRCGEWSPYEARLMKFTGHNQGTLCRIHSEQQEQPVWLSLKSQSTLLRSVDSGARCTSTHSDFASIYRFYTPGRAICTFPKCIPRNRWIKFNYLFWLNLIRFLKLHNWRQQKGISSVIHLLCRSRELLPQKNGSSTKDREGMRVKVSYYYTSEPAEHWKKRVLKIIVTSTATSLLLFPEFPMHEERKTASLSYTTQSALRERISSTGK